MNAIAIPPLYTPEELQRLPDNNNYELIDGRLVEKDMGGEASFVGWRIGTLVGRYLDDHPCGWGLQSNAGYQCFPHRPNLVRKPDVSFIRRGRLPGERIPRGNIRIAPDLAVEVVSPNDLYYEVDEKVTEYLHAGVSLVWVVNPDARTVHVYRPDQTVSRLDAGDELDGGTVLPGFRCRVAELFPVVPAEGDSAPADLAKP